MSLKIEKMVLSVRQKRHFDSTGLAFEFLSRPFFIALIFL